MATTSREIVERLLRAGLDHDADTFVSLMADDGYLEWPYRPPGVPERIQGRPAIHRHLTETAGGFVTFTEHRDTTIHQTLDPEIIIAEYEAHGTVVATGAPFRQRVIAVFTLHAGRVCSCRDYIDPLPLMKAFAGTP